MLEAEAVKIIIGSMGATGAVIVLAFLWVKSITDAHKQDVKDWNEYLKGESLKDHERFERESTRNNEQLKLLVTAVDKLATVASGKTNG